MTAPVAAATRSDARENRERILTAAKEAFSEHGLGVSLVEIARRAGVGNATLHRNFTKEQLIDELFAGWFADREALAARALADPDPWHGLVSFLEAIVVDGGRNCALGPLFAIRPCWRGQFSELVARLLVRAQDAGSVRSDLTSQDVTLIMLGVARTIAITAPVAPEQWRRHFAVAVDGMRAEHRSRLPGLPASREQVDEALCLWSGQLIRNGQS